MKYKVPDNIKKASSLMLKLIIDANGGLSEVGVQTNLSRQLIYKFTNMGYISLLQVYSIAKKFRVSIWSLSYVKLMEVFGEQTPNFEVVVKDVKCLSSSDKEKILKIYKK